MPYLNIDLSYFTHRKTCRLIGLLGRGAELLPIRLWAHCGAHHCEDGRMIDYSPQEIESMVQWRGKPGDAVAALVKVRFLEEDGTGYRCHDWLEHQGHLAAFKAKGKAMAEARWRAKRDAASNAGSIAEDPPPAMPQPTDPTEPTEPIQPTEARGRGGGAKDPLDIPPELHSPAFSAAWQRWMTFRRGLGKKPKDWAAMFSEQLAWLKGFGAVEAAEIVGQSIRNGWQGLFERKSHGSNNRGNSQQGNGRNFGLAGADDVGKAERILAGRRAKAAAEAAAKQVAGQVAGHGGDAS